MDQGEVVGESQMLEISTGYIPMGEFKQKDSDFCGRSSVRNGNLGGHSLLHV